MNDHPSPWTHSGLTCRELAERASQYLDHRLPLSIKVRVVLHLALCAGCRAYVKQISLVSSALRNLPKRYPSPINCLRLRQQFAVRYGQPTSGN